MLDHKNGDPAPKKPYEKPRIVAHKVELGIYGLYGQDNSPGPYLGSEDPRGPKTSG